MSSKYSFTVSGLLAQLATLHERGIFQRGRLRFYRDCVDSHMHLRDYVGLRAAQLERREHRMHGPVLRVSQLLSQGKPAAEALKAVAPATDVALIQAYERKGMLNDGLLEVIKIANEEANLRKLVRKALTLPIVYLVLAFVMISFGIPLMINEIGPMLPAENRTIDQVVLISFAGFMYSWSLPLALLFVGLTSAMLVTFPFWTGPIRRSLDQWVPTYRMYRAYSGAVFLQTLAVQLSVTPKFEDALASIAANSSPWLRMYVETIIERLPHHRLNPVGAFEVGLLDPEIIDSLAIISQRGTAEQAISMRAKESGSAAIESIDASVGILRNVAILIAGGMLVWSAYSLILGLVKNLSDSMMQAQTAGSRRP